MAKQSVCLSATRASFWEHMEAAGWTATGSPPAVQEDGDEHEGGPNAGHHCHLIEWTQDLVFYFVNR